MAKILKKEDLKKKKMKTNDMLTFENGDKILLVDLTDYIIERMIKKLNNTKN